jgi:FkbM family methyltransferase
VAAHDVHITEYRLSNGLVFHGDVRTPVAAIVNEIFRDGVYDHQLVQPCAAGGIVIDIGANVGVYAARMASPPINARVFAFEPSPATFDLLTRNMTENGLTSVRCIPAAVATSTGLATLYLDRSASCDSLVLPEDPELEARIRGSVRVKTLSLEDIYTGHGLNSCNVIKIDAEGAELGILRSASREVIRNATNYVVEYHDYLTGYDHRELVLRLEGAGFDVAVRGEPDSGVLFATRVPHVQ